MWMLILIANICRLASMILIMAATLLLGTFPNWHTVTTYDGSEHEVKPLPSRPVSQVALSLSGFAVFLSFVSAFWLHIGAAAAATTLNIVFGDTISASVGPAAVALAWIAFFSGSVAWLALFIMILSIKLLDLLTDEN